MQLVVMDCDLQDRPEEILKLYEKAQSGYDIVVGRRAERRDNWMKKALSRAFFQVFTFLSGTKVDHRIGNFGIYARKVVNSIRSFKEQNRSFGLFAIWVGFRRDEIDVEHAARAHGRSSYTFRKLAKLALDSIVAHSDKLLLLTVKFGLLVSLLSLVFAAWIVLRYLFLDTPIIGWTSLAVSIYLTAGLVIGTIGIVGLYVGKIFDEVKRRPIYIIDSLTFEKTHKNE